MVVLGGGAVSYERGTPVSSLRLAVIHASLEGSMQMVIMLSAVERIWHIRQSRPDSVLKTF